MTEQYNVLSAQWEVKAANLPHIFDDTAALRHIQSVIYPHTEQVTLGFGLSQRREGDLLYSTVVNLNFKTSYWQFLSILYNLVEHENLGNRVVNYTLSIQPLEPEEFHDMVRGPGEEFIPEHILAEFAQDFFEYFVRGNTEVEILGLHTITANMQVEYLSITPGLIDEGAMRVIWDAEDLLAAAAEAEENQ